MKSSVRGLGLALLLLAGCSSSKQYWFYGQVFDGATGALMTSYAMTMTYADTTVKGTVDKTGRFKVGPLASEQDYTVTITATGYRPFVSTNSFWPDQFDDGTNSHNVTASLFYNANLFPTALSAPAATINVVAKDSATAPSGTVRLKPYVVTSGSATSPNGSAANYLDDQSSVAVPQQLWTNDADTQQSTLVVPLTDGVAQISAGQLAYGVTYTITVYDVPGYVANNSGSITGGDESSVSMSLSSTNSESLQVVYVSTQSNTPVSHTKSQVDIVFNMPIEFGGDGQAAAGAYANDVGAAPDASCVPTSATPTPPTMSGTPAASLAISGNQLSISLVGGTITLGDGTNCTYSYSVGPGILLHPAGDPFHTVDLTSLLPSSFLSVLIN